MNVYVLSFGYVTGDTGYVEWPGPPDKIRRRLELLESLFEDCHFLFYVSPFNDVIE